MSARDRSTEAELRSSASHGVNASAAASGETRSDAAALAGEALASAVGAVLERRCPPDAIDDPAARTRCADALTEDPTLRAGMRNAYLRWGAQSPGAGFNLAASNTTLFDPLVWRRLYLSTFAFPGGHRVEQSGEYFIAHVPVVFRNELDAGEYPYPFWHSQPKWQSYERTEELLIFIERESEPRVALFGFLFSRDNPHVAPLETAFRAFSEKQRSAACTTCHNPSNPSKINPLEFFNYPNQALTGRHDIVAVLTKNRMPPSTESSAAGIADPAYRAELLRLAEDFAAHGDRALSYEIARLQR